MKNPWLKRNPFLSMWLSGVNSAVGTARSRVSAEAARQAAHMQTAATKQVVDFWTTLLTPPPRAKPTRRRRRRA